MMTNTNSSNIYGQSATSGGFGGLQHAPINIHDWNAGAEARISQDSLLITGVEPPNVSGPLSAKALGKP